MQSVFRLFLSFRWRSLFPFLGWMLRTNKKTLSGDVMAGVTGAILVLPQCVAFAVIAGLPPEYGLYTGMIPVIISALFGSSWHMVSGPTTAVSIILFSSLSVLAEPESAEYIKLALTVTLMVGLFQTAMGFFKLGTLFNFISHSVVIGMTSGAGVLIAAHEIKNFFGLHIPRGASFYGIFEFFVLNITDISIPITIVGITTLAGAIIVRRSFPKIPYMIFAMILGTGLSVLLKAVFDADIPTAGSLPSSLPPFSMPSFDLRVWRDLIPTSIALTLFSLTVSLSISRSIAIRSRQQIKVDQEFIGQGLSNIVGGFFSSYVSCGSFNRSALNYDSGAKTPLSSILSAVFLGLLLFLTASVLGHIPYAAMAAVLFIIGLTLIDVQNILQILKASRSEAMVLAVTFLSTLFFDLEQAIFAGVFLSLAIYLHKSSNPGIRLRVPDPSDPDRMFTNVRSDLPECPQLRIVRIDGDIFFAAVNAFNDSLLKFQNSAPDCKHVAIKMRGVNFIDVAGAEALARLAHVFKERGGGVYLLSPKAGVLKFLEGGGYIEEIGRENIYQSTTIALHDIQKRFNKEICQKCPLSVFVECEKLKKLPETEEKPEKNISEIEISAGHST